MPSTGTDHNSTASARGLSGLDRDYYEPPSDCFSYETIKFSGRLEILDPEGRVVRFTRRQQVRFLENGVSVFMHRVWGEGVLFANYAVQGLRIIDAIPTRKGYVVLLALPKQFAKGDTLDIVTRRSIVGAFIDGQGYWETTMDAPTDCLTVDVVAPEGRTIKRPEIIAAPQADLHATHSPRRLRFMTRQPAINVPYRLAWSWK